MFRLSFAGKPCFLSSLEAANLRAEGKPIPSEVHRCNSFFNPLGREPARGFLLIQRRDLIGINLNYVYQLVLQFQDQENVPQRPIQTRTLSGLTICKEPLNLFPSNVPNDTTAVYLVEIADCRWRVHNQYFQTAIKKYYNVRAGGYQGAGGATEFLADSLNSGALWTWQTMVSDIWNLMSTQLGTAPTLPGTPDGNPEGFIFLGMSAWDALTQVLDKLGYAVRVDHTQPVGFQCTIVDVGAPDLTSDKLFTLADRDNAKIHDGEFEPLSRRLPAGVRVFFHRQEKYTGQEETTPRDSTQWFTQSAYTVDVAGPDPLAEPGIYHPIWDDLPAIYDAGSLQNGSALNTRAIAVTANYYSTMSGLGGNRLWKRYTGLQPFTPGSTIRGVSWLEVPVIGMDGQPVDAGVMTEVVRHPLSSFRANDYGRWEECCPGQTKLQAPDLRPTLPTAQPLLSQWLRISSGTPSGIYYTATVERYDHATPGFLNKESVLAIDPNGAASLAVGYYLGRLVDYTMAPVYALVNATTGAGPPGPPGLGGTGGGAAYARVVTQSAAGTLAGDAYTATATTLTKTSNGALPALDTVTMAAGDNILFLLEGNTHADYGLWTITSLGGAGAPWVLTREASDSVNVTGAANNGSGLIRLTVASTAGMVSGIVVTVTDVTGTTEANGPWSITVIDGTHIDLVASSFVHAWVSGGFVAFLVGDGVLPVAGLEVYVSEEGDLNPNTVWQLGTKNPITNGSTAQLWTRIFPEVRWVQTDLSTGSGGLGGTWFDNNLNVEDDCWVNDVDGAGPIANVYYIGVRAFDQNGKASFNIKSKSGAPFATVTTGPIVTAITFDATTCVATVTTKTLSALLPTGSTLSLI